MLAAIEPCEPPEVFRERLTGPTRPVDCAILEFLNEQSAGVPLGDVTRAVGGTTHHIHFRINTLMARGLVRRDLVPGGPQRGPGASVYRLTRTASWTCPS